MRQPALIRRGACGRVAPEDWVRQLADALPSARRALLADGVHAPLAGHPERVAADVIRFRRAREAASGPG